MQPIIESFLRTVRDKPTWGLLFLLGLHLGYYFWAGPYFSGSDDLAYAQVADTIRKGTYQLQPHMFFNRFGGTAVPAIIFQLFGISIYTTTLWPLLCSLSLITALYWVTGQIFGRLAGFFAGLLLATNTMHITYTLFLMTDGALSMLMFLSTATLYFARQAIALRQQIVLGLLFSLLFTFAFISKASALWAFPFIFSLMCIDLFKGKQVILWLTISISGLLLAIVYFGIYYIYTGDFFYRFTGVNQLLDPNQQLNAKQMRDYFINKPLIDYIKRLTYQPLQMIFATPALIIPFLLAWPPLLQPFKSTKTLPEASQYWALLSWSILLFFWFGSNSSQYYTPFGVYDYYLLTVTPMLCLLGGLTLAHLIEKVAQTGQGERLLWSLAITIMFLPLIQKLLHNETMGVVFTGFPILVLALGVWILPNRPWKKTWLPISVVALIILLYPMIPAVPIMRGFIGETKEQKAEHYLIKKYLAHTSQPTVVLSDHRTRKVIRYFLNFEPPANMQLFHWGDVRPEMIHKQDRLLYFVNMSRLQAIQGTYDTPIPEFITHPPKDWKLLETLHSITLYEAQTLTAINPL